MISGDMAASAAAIVFRVAVCAFIAFGAGYWIVTSWIDKRLSAVEAAGLLAGLVVALFFVVAYAVQNSLLLLFIFVLIVGALAVVLTGLSRTADRRLHQRFDDEDVEKYLAALDLDPKNVAAHSLLAKVYRRQGRLEEALAEYKEALRLSPELQEERYWIDRLMVMIEEKAQRQTRPARVGRDSPCTDCGAIVAGDETICPNCGKYVGKG